MADNGEREDLTTCTSCDCDIDLAAVWTIQAIFSGSIERLHFCSMMCWVKWLRGAGRLPYVGMTLPTLDSFDVEDLQDVLNNKVAA